MLLHSLPALPVLMHPLPPLPASALLGGPTSVDARINADTPSTSVDRNTARISEQRNPFARFSVMAYPSLGHTTIRSPEPTTGNSGVNMDAPPSATIDSPGARILGSRAPKLPPAGPEVSAPRRSGKYASSVLPVSRPSEPMSKDSKISTDTPSASVGKPKVRIPEHQNLPARSPAMAYSSVEPVAASTRSREPMVEDSKTHTDVPPSVIIGVRIPGQNNPLRRYSSLEPGTSIRPREPTVEDSKPHVDAPPSAIIDSPGARTLESKVPPARPEVPAPRRLGQYAFAVLPVSARPDEPINKDAKINGGSLPSNSVYTAKAGAPEQKPPGNPTIPAVTVPPRPGGVQLPVYPTSLRPIGPTNGNANSNLGAPPYAGVDEPKVRAPGQKPPGIPPTIPAVTGPPRPGGVQLPTSLRAIEPTNGNANSNIGAPPYANVDKPEAQTLQEKPPPTRSSVMATPSIELAMSPSSKEPNEKAKVNIDAPSSASIDGPRARILEKQTPETPAARPAVIAPLRPKEPTTEDPKPHTDIPPPVETVAPQILELQPPGTPLKRPSVMEHPFFALAMSLRPVGILDIDESASGSALPPSRSDRAKAIHRNLQTPPKIPAAMANSSPGPKIPLPNETDTSSDPEASTRPPDALPRPLNPQKKPTPQKKPDRSRNPNLQGPESRGRNLGTPRPIPVPPTTVTPQDALGGGSRLLKCSKCPPSRKQFKNEKGLTQHLESGYHERESETLNLPPSSDLPNATSRTSSRSSRSYGRQSDNDPATPPQQDTAPSTSRRLPTRNAPVPVSAVDVAASIQKITAALARTTRVTVSDHLLHGIDAALSETQSTPYSPIPSLFYSLLTALVLVISPTREVAIHVAALLSTRGITCYACVGGTIVREDQKRLAAGPHVVSGTLGRVADMLKRGILQPRNIAVLVLNRDVELLRTSHHEQLASVYQFFESDTKIVRAAVGGGSSMSLLL